MPGIIGGARLSENRRQIHGEAGDINAVVFRPQQPDRRARTQPLARSPRRPRHPSLYRPSLRLLGLQAADDQADRHHQIGARRLDPVPARLDILDRHRISRHLGRGLRALGRNRRAAPRDVCLGLFLRRRLPGRGGRCSTSQYLDRLSRLRRAGRDRAGDRLYLAGLDPDQMVPRPAGHGDRHGDHGLRWRRDDRLAAVAVADEILRDAGIGRRGSDIRDHGRDLFPGHDVRRFPGASACRWLDARGVRSQGRFRPA